MMYNPFNMLLNLVCLYFIYDFLHVCSQNQSNTGLIESVRKCSLLCSFLEVSEGLMLVLYILNRLQWYSLLILSFFVEGFLIIYSVYLLQVYSGFIFVLDPVLVICVLVGICHPIYLIQFVDVQLFIELFYSPYLKNYIKYPFVFI